MDIHRHTYIQTVRTNKQVMLGGTYLYRSQPSVKMENYKDRKVMVVRVWERGRGQLQKGTEFFRVSYLGGGNQEDHGSRSVQAKSLRSNLNQWLGTVVCICNASYMGKHK
jgi:hypothetical protein